MTSWLLHLGSHDERILNALLLRRRAWLDTLMRQLTHLGDARVTVGTALLLLLFGPREAGAPAAFALTSSHIVVQLLKRAVARPRPRLPLGMPFLVPLPACFSFPSGHAAAALSVFLPLASVMPGALGPPLLGLALLVGVSRAYLGVHYPSDVLIGWLLAATAVFLAAPALALIPFA